jgi:hypothetical protein
MTLEAWSTWYSIEVSQGLGTESSNRFGDHLGPTTSESDAKRSSQALGTSASRYPRI